MPKAQVHRSSEYSNKIRDIGLYLDGNKIGKIADGETVDFELDKGEHKLIAKIDWVTSNEIKFRIEDQDIKFHLSGTSPFLVFYYATFGRKNYLKLKVV